jgi:hypothetical protein
MVFSVGFQVGGVESWQERRSPSVKGTKKGWEGGDFPGGLKRAKTVWICGELQPWKG